MLVAPYGVLIRARQAVQEWARIQQITSECRQIFQGNEDKMLQFLGWMKSVEKAFAEGGKKSELDKLKGQMQSIFQNETSILGKFGEFLNWTGPPESGNPTSKEYSKISIEMNSNQPQQEEIYSSLNEYETVSYKKEPKDLLRDPAKAAAHSNCLDAQNLYCGSVNNDVLDMANVTLLKIKNVKVGQNERMCQVLSCCPLSIIRIYCLFLIITGLLFSNWFIGCMAYYYGGKVFQIKLKMFHWILCNLAGVYHFGSYSAVLFCYLSAHYSGKTIHFFQKLLLGKSDAQHSCALFQIFNCLTLLIYLKGILLLIYITGMAIFTGYIIMDFPECSENSFRFCIGVERLIVILITVMNYSIVLDAFFVRKVSAFGNPSFGDLIRMLCCWRLHSQRCKCPTKIYQ